MNILRGLIDFLSTASHWSGSDGIPVRILQHLQYTALGLLIASVIAIPVGLFIGHTGRGSFVAVNAASAARALPTVGLLTLVVTLTGFGIAPVLVALVVLAVPPILAGTYSGIRAVDPAVVDAARGIGMREGAILGRVEIPLALPLIFGGFRSATLQVISTATVAAYVALGGLGRFVIDGLAVRDYSQMLAGAVLVAVLAIVVDGLLVLVQRAVVSPGVSGRTATRSRIHRTGAPRGAGDMPDEDRETAVASLREAS